MKPILLTILAFFLIGDLYSQTVNDFDNLIKIFNQGKDAEIPDSLAKKYFDFTPNPDPNFGNKALHVKEIVFENNKILGLSAYSDCGAGGICEHTDLIVLTRNGQLVDKLAGFESDMADCSFEDIEYCSYYSDSLLIVVSQSTEGDCSEDTLFSNKINIKYVHISPIGKISQGMRINVDTRRKYYISSTDILFSKDLIDKSKQDLAIMRNEIFAAHGYRFKTDKWADYFGNEIWYEPRFDNVDERLTLIEKQNIELIIKHENK